MGWHWPDVTGPHPVASTGSPSARHQSQDGLQSRLASPVKKRPPVGYIQMRNQWYGDNRDLVKWGVLFELARRYGATHILQVLYQRPTAWGQLEIDGELVRLPDAVIEHFRSTAAVSAMRCSAKVEVISEEFMDRSDYLQIILHRIQSRAKLPGIVFLDPDTGLEPSVAGPEHVLESELAEIWSAMRPRDVLALYQHQTNRNGAPWVEQKKSQFERALEIAHESAKLARAAETPRDVALFFVQKSGPRD